MNVVPLFQTSICGRLGIQYSIFQAGVGYVADADLPLLFPTRAASDASVRA